MKEERIKKKWGEKLVRGFLFSLLSLSAIPLNLPRYNREEFIFFRRSLQADDAEGLGRPERAKSGAIDRQPSVYLTSKRLENFLANVCVAYSFSLSFSASSFFSLFIIIILFLQSFRPVFHAAVPRRQRITTAQILLLS